MQPSTMSACFSPPAGFAEAGNGGKVEAPDRRRSRRRRVIKGALIVFPGSFSTITCLILDESDSGARLRPTDTLSCPKQFILKPSMGAERDCEVAWRRGTDLGVRYL